MPLTESVNFKCVLQKGNRIQIPRVIRWQFKLESTQALRVIVSPMNSFTVHEDFYAQMSKDGRITIPKLRVALLRDAKKSLIGRVMEVTLRPTEMTPYRK